MKRKSFVLILLVLSFVFVLASCGVANKQVDSIQIISGAPTEIEVGKTPDFSNIKLKVTYNDGEIRDVSFEDVTISKIDTSKVGKVDYFISYDGGSLKATINVKASTVDGPVIGEVTLESISYLSGIMTEFYEGSDFHTTDLKITAHYSDGSTKTVSSDKITVVQNINRDAVGEQTLIVEYEKKRCEIKINVLKIEPSSLTLTLGEFDSQILVGDTFDTSLITATLNYNNSQTKTVQNSELVFTLPDCTTAGRKTITAFYAGMTAECNVEVLGIKTIEFSGFKNSIKFDEELDLSAITAKVIATNNEEFTISADKITVDKTKFDKTLEGTNVKNTKISFSYCGASAEYTVEVSADREDATLTSLSYVSGVVTRILVGQSFDDSGIIASANRTFGYNSIGTIRKSDLTVSGTVNTAVAGTYPVTYSLTEGEVTKSFTINVVVAEPKANDLVLNVTDLGWVLKGESVDTSSVTATLYYEYGTKTTPISNSELAFTVDTSVAGEVEITVYHEASGLTEKISLTVVEIESVIFSGMRDRYRVNNQIDRDNVVIFIIGTNGKTYTRSFDENATLPTLSLDITKRVEEKEYVFTYYGVEYKKAIEVYADFEDATLEDIEYSGIVRVFKGNDLVSGVSVKANYTYGFTREYTVANGVTISGEINTGVTGSYEITVSYEGKTATATIDVVFPEVTGIVINSAPYGIFGEEYDFDLINVTITLENNTTVTASLSDLADYNITASIDTATPGTKALGLFAGEKVAMKEVKIYEIERVVISTDNFDNIVQLDTEFSTEGLGKIYVYLNGLQEPAIREVTEFTYEVDTSVTGSNNTLYTSYLGVKSEIVTITVADRNFIVTGVEDPSSIVAFKNGTYSGKFLDSGYAYAVGDDNPFKYELKFHLFDIINNLPDTRGMTYEGTSFVTLNGAKVGTDYVVIDEVAHTFHFTEKAIGNTFVITTSHKDYPEYTKSLQVLVVDGYNVYEAKELNLLTNREGHEIGKSGKDQLTVLYNFLANNQIAGVNNLANVIEFKAFVDSINGIIIHNNIIIQRSDLPEDYFFTTKSGEQFLWDHQSIYYREFTEHKFTDPSETTPETFNVYGNYFTVISNNIPIVAAQGTTNNNNTASNDDDGLSSSELLRFNVSSAIFESAKEQNKFYKDNYCVNMYAIGFHDNEPTVAVQPELAQKRAKLGIIGLKFANGVYNLNAVNMDAYFTSTLPEYDDLTVNFDYCTLYNSWNNHVTTWSYNQIDENDDGKYDGSIHEGYSPITVNVTNSFMGKCGGPVFINSNKLPMAGENTNAPGETSINIDDKSVVFSYVKGDESWFNAYGATPVFQMIKMFNAFFEPNGASFLASVNNNRFINLIMINMDADFNPTTFAGSDTDIDGMLTVGGQIKLDMNDCTVEGMSCAYGHNTIVDTIILMAKKLNMAQPPIFVTDLGGASYTDTKNLYIVDIPGLDDKTDKYLATNGNYLSMFLYNLGALVGFNEDALDKEPTPESCEIVRITATHGYN